MVSSKFAGGRKFGDHLDFAYERCVEASEIVCRNPILAVVFAAGLVNFVVAKKLLGHTKTGDVAFARSGCVPSLAILIAYSSLRTG